MEILEMTIDKEPLNGKLSEDLYENAFPGIARFVSKMKGSFQDAKDIFHDALVIFHERNMDPQFILNTSAEAYILGIAKHLWLRKFKQDHKKVSLDTLECSISIPQDYYPTSDNTTLLQLLENSGKKCMDLLRAFYYENQPMKNIMHALGYKNEHAATVQKYKCMEKVRNTIKEKSITYEDFIE